MTGGPSDSQNLTEGPTSHEKDANPAPVDDPDALLDAVLPHLTNDGVEPFLRAFLASPPRVGRKRTRSHWDCGESDGAPEAMCSAAGQDAGGGGFVDLEAGRSSGSEAGDEDDEEEAGSRAAWMALWSSTRRPPRKWLA